MNDDDLKHLHRVTFFDDEGADTWKQIDEGKWISKALGFVAAVLIGAALAVALVIGWSADEPMDSVPDQVRFEQNVKGNWL